MDKYEYQIRLDQIKALLVEQEYEDAMAVCDTIDWKKVKNTTTLCTVSEIYKINRRYEDARDIILMAYERHPDSKRLIYALCELEVKMDNFLNAHEFYKEFVELAPNDPDGLILQYKVLEILPGTTLEERIEILEQYNKVEYKERWFYELAYLYHRDGNVDKCVAKCEDLLTMFSEGKYVEKALELKKQYKPLTKAQQNKYDAIIAEREAEMAGYEDIPQDSEYYTDEDGYYSEEAGAYSENGEYYPEADGAYAENGEYYPEDDGAYAENGEYYPEDDDAYTENGEYYPEDDGVYAENGEYYPEDAENYPEEGEGYSEDEEYYPEDELKYSDSNEDYAVDDSYIEASGEGSYIHPDFEQQYTQELEPVPDENGIIPTVPDEDAIKVKEMRVDKFSTMNIQAEFTANVKEFFDDTENNVESDDFSVEEELVAEEAVVEEYGDDEDEIRVDLDSDIADVFDEENIETDVDDIYSTNSDATEETVYDEMPEDEAVESSEVSDDAEEAAEASQTSNDNHSSAKSVMNDNAVQKMPSNSYVRRRRDEEPGVRIYEPKTKIATRKAEPDAVEPSTEIKSVQHSAKSVEDINNAVAVDAPEMPERAVRTKKTESRMNRFLAQDGDGQISMIVPENQAIEKQITGQINIDGYMEQWEKDRKERQRLRIANAKRKSLEQTNDIVSQLEGILPSVTGPIPTVDELVKTVKLPEEMNAHETAELNNNLINAGIIDENSVMVQPESQPEFQLELEPETEPELQLDLQMEQPAVTNAYDTSQIPVDDYATGHIPEIDIPSGYEYDNFDNEKDTSYGNSSAYDTSQIPVDDYATGHIPEIDDVTYESEYDESEYDESEYDEPEYDESEYDEPEYDESEYDEPEYEESEYDEPEYEDSEYDEPEYEESEYEESEYEESEYDEPEYDIHQGEGRKLSNTDILPDTGIAGQSDYISNDDFDDYDDAYYGPMDYNSPGYDIYSDEELEDYSDESDDAAEYEDSYDEVDDDLETLFGEYINLRGMKKKIPEILDKVSMTPISGNVIITGNERAVRLSIASAIARSLQKKDAEFTGKVAKITAAALNSKDVRKAVAAINHGAFIIEEAGQLTVKTLDTLAKCINHSSVKILIILEDEKSEMRKVSKLRSYFSKLFDLKLEVPVYSNDDLVNYAKTYALENECAIDEMGVLALYKKIDDLKIGNHQVTLKEIEAIMDRAFKNVDKNSLSHFCDVLMGRRYNKDDLMIIRERDFE